MKSAKKLLKKKLGRHYDTFLWRPYARLRTLKRSVVLMIKNFLFSPMVIGKRSPVLSSSEKEQLFIDKARELQSRLHPWGGEGGNRRSLLFLQKLIWSFRIRHLESYYRWHYRQLGARLDKRRVDIGDRLGLLLVIGTLGAGGSERQVTLTLLGLVKRGIKPITLAVAYLRNEVERFYQHKLEHAGINVIELHGDASRSQNAETVRPLKILDELPGALCGVVDYARIFAQCRPETVHLWLDEMNVKGGIAAVVTGVPRIILSGRSLPPNNFNLYQPYMREGYHWLLRKPGVTFINNSAAGAHAYERWLGLPKGSISVVHNGFDFDDDLLERCRRRRTAYRERHGIPLTAPVVGTVIRLSEEKRPLLWAEIAAQVGQAMPEAHFLVVGGGPLRDKLEARAGQPDLSGRMHLVGLEKQALEAIASMDIFLLTSRLEGLSNVLIEAQALGVPAVTTRAGGAPEALQHKTTGWVLSSDKPDHAAAEIVRLLKDEPWLRTAGKAGPEFVKSRFGLQRMLDETTQLYESV
ncbi:MAG TPA: glycosyltransferase [Gammaproteobacteria bacterium]|nr:glycosyltransferase [Gammaproteobacteria bacterium]